LEHGVSESGISGERDIGQWVMMRVSPGFNESAESAFKNIEKMEIILIENFFGPVERDQRDEAVRDANKDSSAGPIGFVKELGTDGRGMEIKGALLIDAAKFRGRRRNREIIEGNLCESNHVHGLDLNNEMASLVSSPYLLDTVKTVKTLFSYLSLNGEHYGT